MSSSANKNIRLDEPTWNSLRMLKFEGDYRSYNEVFSEIFNTLESHDIDISEYVKEDFSQPYNKGENVRTIIVEKDVHRRLGYYKMLFMQATGSTARGAGSVSISQIVEKLLRKYKELSN
jgi:hypothetical protein